MFNFPLNPALTRPLRIHSLADALTLFFADMSLSPWKFGTDQQQRNTYFLVRLPKYFVCSSANLALGSPLKNFLISMTL